jgi:hypothetical protein
VAGALRAGGFALRGTRDSRRGPPWDTTACLWFTDRLASPDGQEVYENRGTIVAKIAWGKVRYYEVNEDTQKVEELDEWLRSHAAGEA